MDVANALQPQTFHRRARILMEELPEKIITEVERLQQPEQDNIAKFGYSTCDSVYLDEMVAKFGLEFPSFNSSCITQALCDSDVHQPDTNLNRLASNFVEKSSEQFSPNRQEFGFHEYLAVTSGELLALKNQVKLLHEIILKLQEDIHKSIETNQVSPQKQKQTQVEREPTVGVGARSQFRIVEMNNVITIELLPLSESSQTKEVPETESVPQSGQPSTDESNERSVIITRSEDDAALDFEQHHESEEVVSSSHPLPAPLYQEDREIENVPRSVQLLSEECIDRSAIITRSKDDIALNVERYFVSEEVVSSPHPLPAPLYQEDFFNQSQGERSHLSDTGQTEEFREIENVPRSVQLLSEECIDRSAIITRSKDDVALNVERHLESEEIVSSPHTSPLCQGDSLQTKPVSSVRKRKDNAKPFIRNSETTSASPKNVRNYRNGESKMYFCEECNKGFSTNANLIIHIRVHTGEKPFKCWDCNAAFSKKSNLTVHQRIHTGERPFKCWDCNATFSHKSSLTIHQRTHTDEKPFMCDICKKSFRCKGYLSSHMNIHINRKPHRCKVCKVAFHFRSGLLRHSKIHTEATIKNIHDFRLKDCDG